MHEFFLSRKQDYVTYKILQKINENVEENSCTNKNVIVIIQM